MAALPKSQVRALYPNAASFTERVAESSITSYSQLRRELDQSTQRGFAVERGDVTPDFHSLAVEIRDANDWPVAAVAVTFLADRVPEERWDALLTQIRATASVITARVQGRRAQ